MGKKPRTAKQRAATRRMIAANRRGKGRPRRFRHGRPGKSYGLVESGGAAAFFGGLAMKSGNGNSVGRSLYRAATGGYSSVGAAAKDVGYNLRQSTPLIGKDPNFKDTRKMVGGGALVALGGKVLRRIPGIRRVARLSFKVDRKTRIRVA